jgi:hypothetical protein
MSHKLKKRIEQLHEMLNPPAMPRFVWCENGFPDVREPDTFYIRWRTWEEEQVAQGMAKRQVD